jgi:protoporphyrin/coproporphyrin ferrochelatase
VDLRVSAPVGVLVMAYGGPASLDDIPGYLADIRHGRPTPTAVLHEITENYRAIGGSSPLLEMSRRQVDALAGQLGDDYRCYLGMRHWSPWIEEVVGEMADDGIRHAVSLVLAPHFSALSVARYQQKVADGLELYRGRIHFEHVPSYHDAPGLVEAFAARVGDGLSRWADEERDRVHVVFTAHSLPEHVLRSGDPYEEQCLETAGLVAARTGLGEGVPPSRGPGRISASTSRSSRDGESATSSSFPSASSPITSSFCTTSTCAHTRSPSASGCGWSAPRR